MSSTNNSSSSKLLSSSSSTSRPPLLEKTQVIVNFNYVYTHKSKKIEIIKGEILQLLQKTNEHWWKCLRPNQPKSFYVPASYVSVLEKTKKQKNKKKTKKNNNNTNNTSYSDDSSGSTDDLENDSQICDTNPMNMMNGSRGIGEEMKEKLDKIQMTKAFFLQDLKEEDNQSLSSIPSNIVTISNEQLAASGSYSNNCSSNSVHELDEEERGDFRKNQGDDEVGNKVEDVDRIDKASSCGSISSNSNNLKKKDPYWSSSLEELAKQIVFPGQGQSTIYFNNPSFKPDLPSNSYKIETKNQRTPPLSSLSVSSDLDNDSVELNSSHERSGPGCCTDDELSSEPPREQDLIRNLANNWGEYKCRESERVFYYNALTRSRSWKPPRLSKTEEANNNVFQIPSGWTQSVDEIHGTVSFINQATGSKVVTPTLPQPTKLSLYYH